MPSTQASASARVMAAGSATMVARQRASALPESQSASSWSVPSRFASGRSSPKATP